MVKIVCVCVLSLFISVYNLGEMILFFCDHPVPLMQYFTLNPSGYCYSYYVYCICPNIVFLFEVVFYCLGIMVAGIRIIPEAVGGESQSQGLDKLA